MSKRVRGRNRLGGLLSATAILCAMLVIVSPAFLTVENFQNMGRQSSTLAILAAGQLFPVLTGGVDFSADAVLAISGVVSATVALIANPLTGWACGIVAGLLVGLLNGVLVSRLAIPPFIATLGTLIFLRGMIMGYTGGSPVQRLPETFRFLGSAHVGPMPVLFLIAAFVLLGVHVLLTSTRFGKHVYAVGGLRRAALAAGVDVVRVEFRAYVLSAIFAGLAGVLLASRINSGQPAIGDGVGLQAVAVVFLGGASFYGGSGGVPGLALAVVFMSLLSTGLNLLGVPSPVQAIVLGVALVFALSLEHGLGRRRGDPSRVEV